MDKDYIEELIRKDIQTLGCSIWGIELVGSSSNNILRVFIDKNEGVTLKDCEKVSRHISKVIEADEIYSKNLSLEVSSPGIERKFFNQDQYSNYLGCLIKVRFKNKQNEYKTAKGNLLKVYEDCLVINTEKEELSINFKDIEKANLEYME